MENKLNLDNYRKNISYFDYYKNGDNEYELKLENGDIISTQSDTLLLENLAEIEQDDNFNNFC